jgi:hypothetical protein
MILLPVLRHEHVEILKFPLLHLDTGQISMFLEKKYDFATSFGGFISMFWPEKKNQIATTHISQFNRGLPGSWCDT